LASTVQDDARKPPKVLTEKTVELDVDLVVMAMGYRNDPEFVKVLPSTPMRREVTGVADRRWTASGILANPASAFANHNDVGALAMKREVSLWAAALPVEDRLWVVGDALTGPATVVEAMAQGRRAAAAVLDQRPAGPARVDQGASARPPRVLVCYSSAGGKTARAAQEIADGYSTRGMVAQALPIVKVGARELASVDMVVVGSWVEGFVVAGVGPSKSMRAWLKQLPRLGGKSVAIYCTFGVSPKDTLRSMRRAFEEKGAVVVAQAAFGPKELGVKDGVFGPKAFGEELASRVLTKAKAETYVRVE
jgi:flavodoxin